MVRKEPAPAVSGSSASPSRPYPSNTGSAKGFFLFGIWTSLVYFAVLAGSVVVRWPLAVVWSFQRKRHGVARTNPRRGYDIATLALAAVFASRFVVQRWLYDEDLTGVGLAKIVMDSIYRLALLVVVWAVRRSDRRLNNWPNTLAAVDRREIEARLRQVRSTALRAGTATRGRSTVKAVPCDESAGAESGTARRPCSPGDLLTGGSDAGEETTGRTAGQAVLTTGCVRRDYAPAVPEFV